MNPDLDKELAFWCELLGITPANGWKVTWGWADKLKAPTGGAAYGLTTVDGDRLEAHIQIHPLTTPDARSEFVDTCAHEVVHCIGARMQALLDAGRERDAHEYLAETLAPAMVKIQSTPRARAFAKAVKQLPKDRTMPDLLSMCMALLKQISEMSGVSPEIKAQADMLISQATQPASTETAEPPSTATPEMAPKCGPMAQEAAPPAAPPPAAAPLEQPGYAKAIDVLLGARPDLRPEQKAFAKKATSLEAAAEYIATIPVVKSTETTVVAAPIELIRGREGKNQPMHLSKEAREQRLVVAKAMGQATEKAKGPAVFEKNGGKYFGLGSMRPSEYRAKRATGWDPKAEFPLASEVLS